MPNESSSRVSPVPLRAVEGDLVTLLGSGDEDAIRAVDVVLSHAIDNRASDIHLEPWDDCLSVRYRIDGLLHEVARLPIQHYTKILGRVKVVARMLTYQKDLPQDGRIDPESTACGKAMRVSTFPTVYGEKIVIRVLDADPSLFAIDALGFRADVNAALRTIVGRPQGTLLLTGPASSGKTTTIYALLKEVISARATASHVATIEDPVEYRLGHIAQTEVNPHVGFTFDAALRALMRQDPEVIMIGEIRDVETARAAIQAGLTGHLVISTIHSGTAAGVFTRLLDMGVEPYLVASSVTGVLAQRLLRRNCPACSAPYEPAAAMAARFGMAEAGVAFMGGKGCDACQGIGYRGRGAIGELLTVDETIANLILSRPRTFAVHEAAINRGMTPLASDGARCVREGLTTIEELARVLPSDDFSVNAGE